LTAAPRLFTAPSFLFANPVNCELSVILVEIINSMLQYQLDGTARRAPHRMVSRAVRLTRPSPRWPRLFHGQLQATRAWCTPS